MSESLPPTNGRATTHPAPGDEPALSNAELVQLRVRVIALENMMVALLANASPQQKALAREMATYISPREGYTPHPLTRHAAGQMNHLVDRAHRYPPEAAS